jgi:hypothetical protein
MVFARVFGINNQAMCVEVPVEQFRTDKADANCVLLALGLGANRHYYFECCLR